MKQFLSIRQINIILSIGFLLLLLQCAAMGGPSGGPKDEEGPNVISISPFSGKTNISPQENIVIQFDERIDPLSVPSSILCIDDEISIKVKGSVVTIFPKEMWTAPIVRISISRNIRDEQKNEMNQPVQLIYSTKNTLSHGQISGQLYNLTTENIIEVALFDYPVKVDVEPFQKVEASVDGSFTFDHLPTGIYTLFASENGISNISEDIRDSRYGVPSIDYFHLIEDEHISNIPVFMDDPIQQLVIRSIDLQNQDCATLIFDDGTEAFYTIPLKYDEDSGDSIKFQPGDSISIQLDRLNRLEKYQTNLFQFIMPEILDTLPPKILDYGFVDSIFQIQFSEPIQVLSSIIKAKVDTSFIQIPVKLANSHTIVLNIDKNMNELKIFGQTVFDNSNNTMADSVKTISIPEPIDITIRGGAIHGKINSTGVHFVVRAENVKTEDLYYSYTDNGSYQLNNLPPGNYRILAYENINLLYPSIFYSGRIVPFERAARFGFFHNIVEVRSRWIIDEIEIVILEHKEEK
jgi:hypothetical protein